jgi:hypothetical protein
LVTIYLDFYVDISISLWVHPNHLLPPHFTMADPMEPAQQPATATWEQAFGYLQHHLNEAATQQQTAQLLMQQQLADLTTALTNFTNNHIPPSPPACIPSPAQDAGTLPALTWKTRPKVSPPPEFSGDCSGGWAFLNSCGLYLHLCSNQFQSDKERILWAISFFKTGCTAKWADKIFAKEKHDGAFPFLD